MSDDSDFYREMDVVDPETGDPIELSPGCMFCGSRLGEDRTAVIKVESAVEPLDWAHIDCSRQKKIEWHKIHDTELPHYAPKWLRDGVDQDQEDIRDLEMVGEAADVSEGDGHPLEIEVVDEFGETGKVSLDYETANDLACQLTESIPDDWREEKL